jgi:hypothetical protein
MQRYEKILIYANFGERKNDVFGYFYEKKTYKTPLGGCGVRTP